MTITITETRVESSTTSLLASTLASTWLLFAPERLNIPRQQAKCSKRFGGPFKTRATSPSEP